MQLSLQDLKTVYLDQLWLGFSATESEHASLTTQRYSNETARSNAYLNSLCLNSFINWLGENIELEDSPQVWPSQTDLSGIWEVVNGTAITIGKTRLVLIPNESVDTEEFIIPQEWIDIPGWSADYYLAIQVDLDKNWLHVWGYATHKTLKQKGKYDALYRTYSLERDYVITDLDVMWVAREICTSEKATVNSLPHLSLSTAESLLVQLSQPSPYSPRLDIQFEQWGALLEQSDWRQQLYEQRLNNLQQVVQTTLSEARAESAPRLVNLSQWFQNVVEAGWKTVDELLGAGESRLAFELRGATNAPESNLPALIEQVYVGKTEHQRKQAAQRLGEVGAGNSEAIAALIHLVRTTDDEETRWTAGFFWVLGEDSIMDDV